MEAERKCAGLPVKESLIVPPTLALLVSFYQWCPGSLDTSWTRPKEGLCLPSTDFFYGYFQNQMAGYGNSEKAAGIGGRTLVLVAKVSVPILPGFSQPGQEQVHMF